MSKIVDIIIFLFIFGVLIEGNFEMFLFLLIAYLLIGRKLKLADKIVSILEGINETNKNYYLSANKSVKSNLKEKNQYTTASDKESHYDKIKASQKNNNNSYEDNGIIYARSFRKKCPRCGSTMKKKEGFSNKYYTCSNSLKCSYLEKIPIVVNKKIYG